MQFHWPALPPLSLATRGSLQTLCCLAPSGQQPKGLLYPVEWGSSWLATGSPRMTSLFMSCPPPGEGKKSKKGGTEVTKCWGVSDGPQASSWGCELAGFPQ